MRPLVDSYSREFVYLRLSVTERCNFRCVYCLPNGYQKPKPNQGSSEAPEMAPELTAIEIQNLVRGFVALGVRKVRLTGGEPTVRRDIVELVRAVAGVPGVEEVALTTNGTRLKELAGPLHRAGLRSINVSIDSLDPERFKSITGMDRLPEILEGLDEVAQLGYRNIKLNAVLLNGLNEDGLTQFMNWVKLRPISVRFIELMRTGHNEALFEARHVSAGQLQFELLKSGWNLLTKGRSDGPAAVYGHPEYAGTIGLIAPYSRDFCSGCNRLRVSSQGALRLCLFGDGDASLRDLLQSEEQAEELVARVRRLVAVKPESHYLQEGKYGNIWNLSSIGG